MQRLIPAKLKVMLATQNISGIPGGYYTEVTASTVLLPIVYWGTLTTVSVNKLSVAFTLHLRSTTLEHHGLYSPLPAGTSSSFPLLMTAQQLPSSASSKQSS